MRPVINFIRRGWLKSHGEGGFHDDIFGKLLNPQNSYNNPPYPRET
jgi:hypothetical protein